MLKDIIFKQISRSISGLGKGRNHIDFWLGDSLGIPGMESKYFHLKRGANGNIFEATPEIFSTASTYISQLFEDNIITAADNSKFMTKGFYIRILEGSFMVAPPERTMTSRNSVSKC